MSCIVLETSGTRCDEFHDKIPSTPSRPVRLDRARPSRYLDVEPIIFHTPVPASAPRPRKRTHSGHAYSSKASTKVSFEKVRPPAVLNMPRTKQQQDAASVLSCLLTRVEKVFKYKACAFRSPLRMTQSYLLNWYYFFCDEQRFGGTHTVVDLYSSGLLALAVAVPQSDDVRWHCSVCFGPVECTANKTPRTHYNGLNRDQSERYTVGCQVKTCKMRA